MPLNQQVTRRKVIVAVFAAMAALLLIYQRVSSTIAVEEPQAKSQQRHTRPGPETQARATSDTRSSSFFKHESHRGPKTKLNCSDCHTIPSRKAPDEIAAATKLTIKGYPYHDSCLGCHRRTPPQFFRGAAPVICTVCHTRSSPHLTARDVSPFPRRSETTELEFPGYFPHDQRDHKRVNCATCHVKDERTYIAIPVAGSETAYKPADGTFKTSPSGHASCFKCHWQTEKPTKDDCAGCHLTPDEVAMKPRNLLSVNAMEWFKNWPREWPKRFSLKFNHESKDHDDECTSCHINIKEMETLDISKADVPIATCAKCHLKPTSRTSIGKEMFEEDDDIAEGRNNKPSSKEGKHTCTGCHTSVIGSMPPPCSHYLLFDDQYLKAEDYPKSAKQLAERCKK